MKYRLAVILAALLIFGPSEGRAASVGHWVDITLANGTIYAIKAGKPDSINAATYSIDSCVVYATAGNAAGTDLRIGKASAKTRPGRSSQLADTLNPCWKMFVNYNGTNLPTAGYGLSLDAVFYAHVTGSTVYYELPGVLTFGTHVITSDTLNSIASADKTILRATIADTLANAHGAGSWTTGSGGLDSSKIASIIKRQVWGYSGAVDSTPDINRRVNLNMIANNNASPTQLDEAFDNDGTGAAAMELRSLKLVATLGSDVPLLVTSVSQPGISVTAGGGNAAAVLTGSGTGPGMRISSSGTGAGLELLGSTGAAGLNVKGQGTTGVGMRVVGGTVSGNAVELESVSGNALQALGGGSGIGFVAQGGLTAGDAAQFTARGGTAHGLSLTGYGAGNALYGVGGATGNGTWLKGGATSGAGLKLQGVTAGAGLIMNGAGSNPGMVIDSGIDINGPSFGPAVSADAFTGSNQNAIRLEGQGTGNGLRTIGGGGGYGLRVDSGFAAVNDGLTTDVILLQQLTAAWNGIIVPGYADSITQQYFPLGGVGNKDSVLFTRWAAGSSARLGKWVFGHGTDPAVADSLRVKP